MRSKKELSPQIALCLPNIGGLRLIKSAAGGFLIRGGVQAKDEGEGEMDINRMTKSQFRRLPYRKNWAEEIEFDSLIILPLDFDWIGYLRFWFKHFISKIFKMNKPEIWEVGHMHDSGYRCMDFVLVREGKPICLLSGCSDVIHINGIGGLGKDWLEKYGTVPKKIEPQDWSIDCLATSGLLRILSRGKMSCGPAISSFELFSDVTEKEG